MKKLSSVINKTYEALVRFPGFPEFHFIADQLIKVKLLQDKSDYIYIDSFTYTCTPKRRNRIKQSSHHEEYSRIIGVLVSVLASSVVDREFELRWGHTKDY